MNRLKISSDTFCTALIRVAVVLGACIGALQAAGVAPINAKHQRSAAPELCMMSMFKPKTNGDDAALMRAVYAALMLAQHHDNYEILYESLLTKHKFDSLRAGTQQNLHALRMNGWDQQIKILTSLRQHSTSATMWSLLDLMAVADGAAYERMVSGPLRLIRVKQAWALAADRGPAKKLKVIKQFDPSTIFVIDIADERMTKMRKTLDRKQPSTAADSEKHKPYWIVLRRLDCTTEMPASKKLAKILVIDVMQSTEDRKLQQLVHEKIALLALMLMRTSTAKNS